MVCTLTVLAVNFQPDFYWQPLAALLSLKPTETILCFALIMLYFAIVKDALYSPYFQGVIYEDSIKSIKIHFVRTCLFPRILDWTFHSLYRLTATCKLSFTCALKDCSGFKRRGRNAFSSALLAWASSSPACPLLALEEFSLLQLSCPG